MSESLEAISLAERAITPTADYVAEVHGTGAAAMALALVLAKLLQADDESAREFARVCDAAWQMALASREAGQVDKR